MAFQVSPGINVSELDLTAGAQQVSVSDAAFAGPFQWGPALVSTNIGSEDELVQTFGKPDDTIAPNWFAAQSFLAYSNLLHVVRAVAAGALNATVAAKPIAGTVQGTKDTMVFTGTDAGFNTGFGTTPLIVAGQKILVGSTPYTVNVVTNSSSFTVTTNVVANTTTNTVSTYGALIKNSTDYETNFSGGATGYGAWAARYAGELGNSIKISVCPSAAAYSNVNLTGSLSITTGSKSVTGSASKFDTECTVGDLVTVGGRVYQIEAIASNVAMSFTTAALATVTASAGDWGRKWQYSTVFDRAPGTSPYASLRGGSADEMHVCIVDAGGKFTGVPGTVLERFAFVSKATDAKDANGEPAYYVTVINRQSNYVWWLQAPTANTTKWASESSAGAFGADLLPTTATLAGGQTDNAHLTDANLETAYDLFMNADEVDISLVISGPASTTLASYLIQNLAESRQDCIVFVSPTKAAVVNNAGDEVADITTFRNALPSSSYGFCDSGWKYAYDKYNDKFRWVPLNGDVAGIAARSDSATDPWYSPAGATRGNVKNVVKLAWNPKQLDRDELYKIGINPIVSFPGQGTLLYGDKTLLSRPSAFDRINVRRLFIILEKTIARLARTQLFEFNDEYTRSQFRNMVEPYLRDVKSRRGVVDYRVVCDDSNNTSEVIEQNRFIGDIFVKPARSINFIQLNFVAVRNGVSFQEVTGAL